MYPVSIQADRDRFLENSASTDFPYDEVERALMEDDPELNEECRELVKSLEREARSSNAGEIVLRVLELLLPSGRINSTTPQMMGFKAIVLLWMVGSSKQDISSKSLSEIAEQLRVSRAILSYWGKKLEGSLGGFHARGQKRVCASESYLESVQEGWKTRRARKVDKPLVTAEP